MIREWQSLATLILNARSSLGLSVRDLAGLVTKIDGSSIAPSYVTDIEKGRSTPSAEITRELACVLQLDTPMLMAAREIAKRSVRSKPANSLSSSKRKTMSDNILPNENAAIREILLDTKPIAIDLFAGIGGLSLGLENA
jgi:transcriptional regulator with XRE-family HTH domain